MNTQVQDNDIKVIFPSDFADARPVFPWPAPCRACESFPPEIVAEAVLNGLLTGAVYGLVALGLTLVYGVLHIINFAHGALLTLAMYAAFVAWQVFGLDPYVAILPLVPLFFVARLRRAALRHRAGEPRARTPTSCW